MDTNKPTGETLLAAAAAGDVATIQTCLAAGVPVDRKDGEGYTPLMRATERPHVEAIQVLLAAGADPHAEATNHFTPLLLATSSKRALRVFMDARVDLDRGNANGVTPLMMAGQQGAFDCVKLLVEAGVDLYRQDRHGRTARERARVDKKIAEYLRDRMEGTGVAPAAPTAQTPAPPRTGATSKNPGIQLSKAAKKGDLAALQAALAEGAPLEWRNRDDYTPLMVATENGHSEIVRALLAAGADPHGAATNTGADALYIACAQGHLDIVEELLQRGADVNPPADRGGTGYTPLMAAALSGNLELVQRLVAAGANVQATDLDGRTAIKWAREQKHKEVVKYLKELMGEPAPGRQLAPAAPPVVPPAAGSPHGPMQALRAIVDNFPIAATEPGFQSLLDLLNGMTKRKFLPSPRRPGIYVTMLNQRSVRHLAGQFHLPAPSFDGVDIEEDMDREEAIVGRLQDEVARAGYLLMRDSLDEMDEARKLWLYPTGEKYAILASCGTNGNNYGHSTRDVIAWLQELENTQPFLLTECGHDRVAGRFLTPVKTPKKLVRQMLEFCPDLDVGETSRAELAGMLAEEQSFYFWWD
ncbi:MAG: ankyrin repeat domain-containing protein [Gemmataceae bacterium]